MFRSKFLWIVPLFLCIQIPVLGQQADLQKEIERRLAASSVPNGFWAVSVLDENGAPLAEINHEKLMVPASNMKLLTSAALLETLGHEFRYQTPIYGEGRKVGRTWHGNLHIVGSGDPSINGYNYDGDAFYVFRQYANQLREAGIDTVSGIVFGNTSVFDGERLPPDWDWYDLTFYYAAEVGPLSFNSNTVHLKVDASGKPGTRPGITWFPFNTDYVRFINNQKITRKGTSYREYYRRLPGSNEITLGSSVPQDYVETEELTISDPTMFFLDSFVKFLEHEGFYMDVKLYEDPFPTDWKHPKFTLLANHVSEPLRVLVQQLNKESDNLYAEMFLRTLANYVQGGTGSIKKGEMAANARFHLMGLDTLQVSIRDGSGLSSTNVVSTGFLSRLLHNMRLSANAAAFDNSLTVAGVDGTFKARMKGGPLEGNLRGKSGFIARARGFSGYLTAKSGKTITFSMITNNFRVATRDIDRVHEAIALYLYENL